MKQKTYLPTFD